MEPQHKALATMLCEFYQALVDGGIDSGLAHQLTMDLGTALFPAWAKAYADPPIMRALMPAERDELGYLREKQRGV